MLHVRDFPPTSTVILGDDAAGLSPAVEAEVEGLWQAEQRRRGHTLFNGRILSAVDIGPDGIRGRAVEYRRFVAQQARPELFDVLGVRPVGVSGLLLCSDGVVFGRRTGAVMQEPGQWELVPSGGLDAAGADRGAALDYRAQILTELHEEIGIGADAVSGLTPYCLVEDSDSHVLDIGIALASPLSARAVLDLHRTAVTPEYDELRIVAPEQAAAFAREQGPRLVAVSGLLLSRFRG